MAVDKEYWNIPKTSEDFLTTQGTNLTVFVDHADNALFLGLGASDVISLVLSAIGIVIGYFAYRAASKASDAARVANNVSVRPELNFSVYIDATKNICRIYLKNSGLGPAIITDLKKQIDGLAMNTHTETIERSFDILDADTVKASLSGLCKEEQIISAGETELLIELTFEEPGDLSEEVKLECLKRVIQSYVMTVTYTDIYRKTKFVKSLNEHT